MNTYGDCDFHKGKSRFRAFSFSPSSVKPYKGTAKLRFTYRPMFQVHSFPPVNSTLSDLLVHGPHLPALYVKSLIANQCVEKKVTGSPGLDQSASLSRCVLMTCKPGSAPVAGSYRLAKSIYIAGVINMGGGVD